MNDIEKFEAGMNEMEVSKWAGKGKTFDQMLETYKINSLNPVKHKLDFKPWLPSLAKVVRPIAQGEMFCILSDTGSGKTAFIQQLIMKLAKPMKTVLFEMELPDDQLTERFIAMKKLTTTDHAENLIVHGLDEATRNDFGHLVVYSEARFSIKDIEEIIDYEKPLVVILDYMGLVRNDGANRYERLSDTAEELKLTASSKKVIMITACQVSRNKGATSGELFLHDARDSSSIENSAQKMIGLWRTGDFGEKIHVKVLKNQGLRDIEQEYNFNNETLNIWQG